MKMSHTATAMAALALVIGTSAMTAAEAKTVIKAGYGTAGGPIHEGMLEFEKRIEAANPNIDVQIFPGGQLGSEGEIIGQLQAGITDLLPTTTGPLGQHNPVFYALETPYVFMSEAHAYEVLDGPIGEKVLKAMESKGLVGLAFWENGFREVTNSVRPIKTPADFSGIKLRVQQNTLHMNFFKKLGANPMPLPFTEIYSALAAGVVDGQENPFALIATNKFFEQQKYISKTDHVYSAVPVFYSKAKWDALPADVRTLVKKTVVDLRTWERNRGAQMQEAYLKEIKTKSEVLELTAAEKKALQKAGAEVYDWAKKKYGTDYRETLDAIISTVK